MDNSQTLDRAQWRRMEDYFTANSALISPLADVNPMVQDFLGKLSTFDALAAQQAAGTGTFASAKKVAIADGAAYISKWGRRCSVQAHTLGLYAVEATINRRPYEITDMPANEAYNTMQAMRDALKMNTAAFATQGFSGAVVGEMDLKLSKIAGLLNAPQEAHDTRENVTDQIETLHKQLNDELEPIVQLLEAEYEDTKPSFVQGLLIAHEKGQAAGKRYTGMEGKVTVNDAAMAGYKVSCAGLAGKVATTDVLGHYSIRTMKPGTYVFEVRDTNGDVKTSSTIRVKQGTTVAKDWAV